VAFNLASAAGQGTMTVYGLALSTRPSIHATLEPAVHGLVEVLLTLARAGPHTFIILDVKDGNGGTQPWNLEGGPQAVCPVTG
jgi:hypothetical protein